MKNRFKLFSEKERIFVEIVIVYFQSQKFCQIGLKLPKQKLFKLYCLLCPNERAWLPDSLPRKAQTHARQFSAQCPRQSSLPTLCLPAVLPYSPSITVQPDRTAWIIIKLSVPQSEQCFGCAPKRALSKREDPTQSLLFQCSARMRIWLVCTSMAQQARWNIWGQWGLTQRGWTLGPAGWLCCAPLNFFRLTP